MLSKEHLVSVGRQLLRGRKEEGLKPRVFTFSFQTYQSAHFPWRGVSKGAQGGQGCHAVGTLHSAGNTHPREALLLHTFMGDDTQGIKILLRRNKKKDGLSSGGVQEVRWKDISFYSLIDSL